MLNVLLAEDDSISRTLIAEMVNKLGFNCFSTENGLEAYKALKTPGNHFDILISDVIMPELDGRDLIKKVRADKELFGLQIIIVSAIVTPKEIAHLLETGATYFLNKPLNMNDLELYLRRCTQNLLKTEIPATAIEPNLGNSTSG